jgi:hypothetical protein
VKTCAYDRLSAIFPPVSNGADNGGLISVRLSGPAAVMLEAADADVAASPVAAVVMVGIGPLKASKNAGVPKVSVRAMAKTCHVVSGTVMQAR